MKLDKDGFVYHCFNCGFAAGWTPGKLLSKNTRNLFQWIGMSEMDIGKLNLATMKIKDDQPVLKKAFNLTLLEKPLPDEIVARLEAKYNLDAPLFEQYVDYMKGLVTFDLGPSYRILGMSVNEMISNGFPTSAKIGGIAAILIIVVGIPIGVVSALKANSLTDYSVMFLATLGVTLPSFVIATGYIYIFAIKLDWVDATGLSSIGSYLGPVIALSGYSLSFVARLSRSSQLEVLQQDYIRTARANGISEFKVIMKHGLKNSLIPVVTYVGPMIAAILISLSVGFTIGVISGIAAYECPKCKCKDSNNNSKQLLKG